jgi:hypothetical protein
MNGSGSLVRPRNLGASSFLFIARMGYGAVPLKQGRQTNSIITR